jgi:hypothetical protein
VKRGIECYNRGPEELQRIAEDLYIYGYPLLLTNASRRSRTAAADSAFQNVPTNQFAHGPRLPAPHDKGVHPNPDVLSSSAWLQLSREPVVLTIPHTHRYHLLSCFSGWYEIFETFSPRTKGMEGGHFAFVGPQWSGKLPLGVDRIVAPTETVYLDGWFAVTAVEDMSLVHAVQDHFRLTPLSEWGSSSRPHSHPFALDGDHKTTPQERVARLDPCQVYILLSKLLRRNPTQATDADSIAEFARIGFFPGKEFTSDMSPPYTMEAMYRAVPAARLRIAKAERDTGRRITTNNWWLHVHPGSYGTNYLDRAVAAHSGLPGALAEDLVCLHTSVDHTGDLLKGRNRYVIKFRGDLLPPVNAFWSITPYNSRQHLVENENHRYVIGCRNRLRLNPDGSLSIHIQHDWPGETMDSNWLPAPKDAFNLAFRMYWPKPDVFTEIWRPPAVMRTN